MGTVSTPTQFGTYTSNAAVNTGVPAQAITADVPLGAFMLVKLSGAGIGPYTLSDSKGHTWSTLPLATQPTGTIMSEQWFLTTCTTALTVAGGDTLTPGRTGTANSLTMIAKYVTGQDPVTPIGNSGVQATGASSSSVTTLSCTVNNPVNAAAGDLVVGGLTVNGNSLTPTSGIFTGITSVLSTTTNTRRSAVGYKQVTGTETDTGQFGWTTANPACTTAFVVTAASTTIAPGAGTVAATSDSTGAGTATAAGASTQTATSSSTGTATALPTAAGTTPATAAATGAARGQAVGAGTTPSTSAATGAGTGAAPAAGTAAATTTSTGAAAARATAAGTTSAVTTTRGAIGSVTAIAAGVAAAISNALGAAISLATGAGHADAISDSTGAGTPPALPHVQFLGYAEAPDRTIVFDEAPDPTYAEYNRPVTYQEVT